MSQSSPTLWTINVAGNVVLETLSSRTPLANAQYITFFLASDEIDIVVDEEVPVRLGPVEAGCVIEALLCALLTAGHGEAMLHAIIHMRLKE